MFRCPMKTNNLNGTIHYNEVPRIYSDFHNTQNVFFDYHRNKLYPGLIHLRPYLKTFLRYCFQHYNVAFWSTGNVDYVRNIVLHIQYMVDKQPQDIVFAWANTSQEGFGHKNSTHFMDCLTGESISQHDISHHLCTEQNHKHLNYVFSKFPKLVPHTVLLVDNLPDHATMNKPENVIYIPPYAYMNVHDTILQSFLHLLKSYEISNTTIPPKTFVLNTNHIREALRILSPTNNNVYYPNGYIDESTLRHYHANPTTLQPNQKIIVPVQGMYVVASVVRVYTPKRQSPETPTMVVVKVPRSAKQPVVLFDDRPTQTSTTKKTQFRTVHVPLSDVVADVQTCKRVYVY